MDRTEIVVGGVVEAGMQIASYRSTVADYSGARTDRELVALWLAGKTSAQTRKAYAADVESFLSLLYGWGLVCD
jgi:hypothetical protein